MSIYYKGKRISEANYSKIEIPGVNWANSTLEINNDTLTAQEIYVGGSRSSVNLFLRDSTLDVSGCGGTLKIINKGDADITGDISGGTGESLPDGVTWADSELTIDNDKLKAHEVYVKGEGNVNLELLDSTIYLDGCENELAIESAGHKLTAIVIDGHSLQAGDIKKDLTLFGITGTCEAGGITPTGTKEITTNGTHDVTNYESVYINIGSGGSSGVTGTAVPNNTFVEKIYINDNVSAKKWYEVFEQLTFLENALLTVPYVPLLFSANGTPIITLEKHNSVYRIVAITDMNNQKYTTIADIHREPLYLVENDVQTDTIACWYDRNYIYNNEWLINSNVISEYMGVPIGTQNDLLKDLISITPFN